jgi:hypothetical protein
MRRPISVCSFAWRCATTSLPLLHVSSLTGLVMFWRTFINRARTLYHDLPLSEALCFVSLICWCSSDTPGKSRSGRIKYHDVSNGAHASLVFSVSASLVPLGSCEARLSLLLTTTFWGADVNFVCSHAPNDQATIDVIHLRTACQCYCVPLRTHYSPRLSLTALCLSHQSQLNMAETYLSNLKQKCTAGIEYLESAPQEARECPSLMFLCSFRLPFSG